MLLRLTCNTLLDTEASVSSDIANEITSHLNIRPISTSQDLAKIETAYDSVVFEKHLI